MSYTPVRDEVAITNAALRLLERDVMLAGTVWRDPVPPGAFARKVGDTVSVYLPAVAVANKRTLRANDARVRSQLKERKVDITLDTDLQVDVALTDEQQTLDTQSIVSDVTAPSVGAIVRGYEEVIADTMVDADYEVELQWDEDNPYDTLVDADVALTDHSVPMTDRFLVVGSALGAQLRKSELLSNAASAGSNRLQRTGQFDGIAGFSGVFISQFLPREVGFAYHRTAYALSSRAPAVPRGVAWGAVQSANGLAVRVMEHLSQNGSGDLLNVVYHDSWLGASAVTDSGAIDEHGKFIAAVDPAGEGQDDLLVRAVKLSVATSE